MRKVIKDPNSPTGWSLEKVPFTGDFYFSELDTYEEYKATCKSDRIPCSGFKEGEEVEKWQMQLHVKSKNGFLEEENWATELELKKWGYQSMRIAVPIKEVTDSSNSDQPSLVSLTPEQKAAELVETFHKTCSLTLAGAHSIFKQIAKQCALICVEEMLANMEGKDPLYQQKTYWHPIDYWQQVKGAITKL